MTNKELIKNILNDISMKVYVGKNLTTGYSSGGSNRVLVLFNGTDVSLNKILVGLKELKSQGSLLKLAFSRSAEQLLNVDEIVKELEPFKVYRESEGFKSHEIVKSTDFAIAVNVTQNTLAKLAVGVQDSLVSNVLWMLLLESVKVVVNVQSVFEGAQSLEKNPVMRSVFEGHVEKIKSFGAVIIKDHGYKALVCETSVVNDEIIEVLNEEKKDIKVKTTKKLVNEQTINDLESGVNELILEKGQIITAAAKDLASLRKIKIVRV